MRSEHGKKGRMKMTRQRRQFSDKFKAKVAVEGFCCKKILIPDTRLFEIKLLFVGRWYEQ